MYEQHMPESSRAVGHARRRAAGAISGALATSLLVVLGCGGVIGDAPRHLHIEKGTELYTNDKATHRCGTTTADADVTSVAQYSATGDVVTSFEIPDPPHNGNCPAKSWVADFVIKG